MNGRRGGRMRLGYAVWCFVVVLMCFCLGGRSSCWNSNNLPSIIRANRTVPARSIHPLPFQQYKYKMSKNYANKASLPLPVSPKIGQKEDRKKTGFSRCGSESLLLQPKTPSSSQVQMVGSSKKLKLRDYLFLMQTNSKRVETARVESPQKLQKMKGSSSSHCLKSCVSTRSIKYGIDNSHVLNVVAADLQADLQAIRERAGRISEALRLNLKEDSLGDDEMVEIYALRRKVKEKVKELQQMQQFVGGLQGRDKMQEVGLSMSIIYQKEQLRKLQSSRQEAEEQAVPT